MKSKKFLNILTALVIVISLLIPNLSNSALAVTGFNLNRVGTRVVSSTAQFYDTVTSQQFRPEGYNYTILDGTNYPDRHLTFDVGYYDYHKTETMLSQLQYFGHNVVRVFIDSGKLGSTLYGVAGNPSTNTRGLYAPVMNNFCDFLSRARNHNIYVIPILNYIPQNSYYVGLGESNKSAHVASVNNYLLSQGYITAKKQYLEDFVSFINSFDSTLLSSIFAYELENEFCVVSNAEPFSLNNHTAIYPANGNTYYMDDVNSRQLMYNESMIYYIDQIRPGARSIDPNAKVMLGMFTNYIVGRSGNNGVTWSAGQDVRFPPSVINLANASSTLDVIDIHLYTYGQSMTTDLDSIQWSNCYKNTKPFLLGEFGASKNYYSSASDAATAMVSYRTSAYNEGFQGSLFWTWNNCAQPFWTALEGSMDIRNILKSANLPTFEDNFDQNNTNNWTVGSGTWVATNGILYQNDTTATFKNIGLTGNTYSDFTAETAINILNNANSGSWSCIQFRKTNISDAPWSSGYTVYVNGTGGLVLYKAGVGVLVTVNTGLIPVNNWVKIRLEAFGNVIKVYENDNLYINTTDSTYTSGYCALGCYGNQSVFDDFMIKNYDFNSNFNNGNSSGWTINSGTWTVANGAFEQSYTSLSTMATITGQTYTDFKAQYNFKILSQNGSNWSAMQVRKTNATDGPFTSGYLVYMTPSGSLNVYKPSVGVIASYSTGLNPTTSYITVRVECLKNKINVYANEIPYLSVLDSTYTSGYCSLVTYNNSTSFDDVLIK